MPAQSGSFSETGQIKKTYNMCVHKRGTWIKVLFEHSFHWSELNIKRKVGSHSLILDSNPVQVFSYPSIIFLKINHLIKRYQNKPWVSKIHHKLWVQEVYELIWREPKCCINFRSPSSRLIKILRISTLSQIKPGSFKRASHTSHLQEMELL